MSVLAEVLEPILTERKFTPVHPGRLLNLQVSNGKVQILSLGWRTAWDSQGCQAAVDDAKALVRSNTLAIRC